MSTLQTLQMHREIATSRHRDRWGGILLAKMCLELLLSPGGPLTSASNCLRHLLPTVPTRGLNEMESFVHSISTRRIAIAPFGDAYEKIGTIQRRLAWPLHK